MYTLNHCKKSSFITFGLRKKAKTKQLLHANGFPCGVKTIYEVNDLQLFKNHKPKVLHQMSDDQMIHCNHSNSRRFMTCKVGSLVLAYNESTALNLRDKQHSQRMARDRFQAQQRRCGWLANDREPKMILGQ